MSRRMARRRTLEVKAALSACNLRNYSIYLFEVENLMFS